MNRNLMIRKTLLTISLILYISSTSSSVKYVWIHGLEYVKDQNIWMTFHQLYSTDDDILITYKPDKSISKIALEIYEENLKPLEDSTRFILIGHNMGGLIARSIELLTKSVTAIITLGTPHNGSILLKNVIDGKQFDFFGLSVKKINAAINTSTTAAKSSSELYSTLCQPILGSVSDYNKNLMQNPLLKLSASFNSMINHYARSQAFIYDLLPNSQYINNLYTATHNVPIINVFGSENYWQSARIIGSFSKQNEVNNPANSDTSFDKTFFNGLITTLSAINQVQNTHNLTYNILSLPAMLNPQIWIWREEIQNARKKWVKLYYYIDVGMYSEFGMNMGAVELRKSNSSVQAKLNHGSVNPVTRIMPHLTDNDGIFSLKDVKIKKNQNTAKVHNIRAEGVNQYEMGTHLSIKKLLSIILGDEKNNDSFRK